MSAQGRSLATALADLRAIKQQIAAHPAPGFAARFAELRAWQSERVAAFHAERATRHDGHDLLVFLTRRFYVEADWSELISRPERMAGAVEKIVAQDRPLVIAIELQAAAERLDMAMTEALLAESRPLSAYSYIRAFRRVDARRGEQAAATHRGSFEGCGGFLERLGRGASHALVSLREVAVPASQTDPCGWLCDRVGLRHNRDLASVFSRRPPATSTATTSAATSRITNTIKSCIKTIKRVYGVKRVHTIQIMNKGVNIFHIIKIVIASITPEHKRSIWRPTDIF